MFKFNIGSAVNGKDKVINHKQVLRVLSCVGFEGAEIIKTELSDTETTYVITATGFDDRLDIGHKAAVYAVCVTLSQDAIAYKADGEGVLVGPKAEDWGGEFLQEHFIE